jgi:plastocyanin
MRALRVLAVAGLLFAACGDDDDDGGSATTETTEESTGGDTGGEATALDVTAVDYGYQGAPEEIAAGAVDLTFTNEGAVSHEFALVEIGDTDLDTFIEDFSPVVSDEGAPFPEYATAVALPAEIPAGESIQSTFLVEEGTYALFCTLTGDPEGTPPEEGSGEEELQGEAHWNRGMIQTLEVTEGETGELPEATSSITAVDYGFEVDVTAGDSAYNFVNDGPDEVHFGGISVFPEGTTPEAAEAAFATLLTSEGPPPEGAVLPEDVGFSGIYSQGLGGTSELFGTTFESGRTYVVACFIQDRAGGPPHAIAYNMFEVFTVE